MCDQQRLRPACAYAQTDQSLCWSLKYYMTVKLLTESHWRFLSLKVGCTSSSESKLVKMPHCWKPRVQLIYLLWSTGKALSNNFTPSIPGSTRHAIWRDDLHHVVLHMLLPDMTFFTKVVVGAHKTLVSRTTY